MRGLPVTSHAARIVSGRYKAVRDVILHLEEVAKSANRIVDFGDLCTPGKGLRARSAIGIAILLRALRFLRDVRPIRQSLYAFIYYFGGIRLAGDDRRVW